MLVIENISSALMAFEAGHLDFLPALDVPYDHEIARLIKSGERTDFHLCHTFATFYLKFNCVSPAVGGRTNPFRDRRVRRAFALAVDKQAVVERVLKRGDLIAHSFVPPNIVSGYRSPVGERHNLREAKQLMADAGFPDGVGLPTVELLYVASDQRVMESMARMWQLSLGADVELVCKESKAVSGDTASQQFMVARASWYGDYLDPATFLDCLATGNGNNDSGYSDKLYDRLLARATSETGDRRLATLSEAESMIVEQDFPILPLFHQATPIAIQSNVTGLYPNARLFFSFRHVAVNR